MSQMIPVEQIGPHPANANVMRPELLAKLRRHLERTGRYEPLVVRPLEAGDGALPRYQVLNGHHRLRVLTELGHAEVRCEVWPMDDREALLLLATINRLEGRDDPVLRANLLARLADGLGEGAATRLARLVPEDAAAVGKALALAREPLPRPVAGEDAPEVYAPFTAFLEHDELATVERALRAAGKTVDATAAAQDIAPSGRRRARALVALAEAYLHTP